MKKTLSVLLALVMIMAMATTGMAATINNPTGHSYNAYQVFKGTQAEGVSNLGDVEWGSGVDGAALLAELNTVDAFADCKTAADVANELAGLSDNCAEARALANIAAKHLTTAAVSIGAGQTSVDLEAGYYLLVDTTNVDEATDARNSALLQVTNKGDVTIAKKYTIPGVDKEIIENNAEVEATDKSIGDTVQFKITGTMPENYADYETYKYVFHDTLSKGLTLTAVFDETDATKVVSGVKVAVDETDVTDKFTITYSGTTLTVACADMKAIEGVTANSTVTVTYSAVLNANAVVGEAGNPNTVYIEYANDPNHTGGGEPGTGKTPEDKVLVFTYTLDADKVDAADNTKGLKDAEFILMDAAKTKVAKIENGKFAGWVDDSTIAKNDDGTYPSAYTLKSDANGDFAIAGLDAGTYYLKETKAPAGYNLLTSPIKIVIAATVDTSEDNPALTALTIDVDDAGATAGDVVSGTVSVKIPNNSGAQLPETGGAGTTALYVGGGILVLAAVALLIAKKRTNA